MGRRKKARLDVPRVFVGGTCWVCGSLVNDRRPRVVQAWRGDTLMTGEAACEVCWQKVAAASEVSLARGGVFYVLRCVAGHPVVASPPDAGAGFPP